MNEAEYLMKEEEGVIRRGRIWYESRIDLNVTLTCI